MRLFNWIKKLRQHKKSKRVIYHGYTFQSEIKQYRNRIKEKSAYHFLVWKARAYKSMVKIRITIEELDD